MARMIISPAEYFRHEKYYRHMMKTYPERYGVIIDSADEYIDDFSEEDCYIKIKAAAGMLGVSKETVKSYIRKGWLKGRKAGQWEVLLSDVQGFRGPRKQHKKQTNNEARAKAIMRDGGKCVLCGSTENLQVHHKLHRADGGTDDLDNLVTLCEECHAKQHEGEPVHNLMMKRIRDRYE